MSNPSEKGKFCQICFTPAESERVEKLKEKLYVGSKNDVIRRCLKVGELIVDESEKGSVFQYVKADGTVVEVKFI